MAAGYARPLTIAPNDAHRRRFVDAAHAAEACRPRSLADVRRVTSPSVAASIDRDISLNERLGYSPEAKLVILSCDDLGSCHAANVGVYEAIRVRRRDVHIADGARPLGPPCRRGVPRRRRRRRPPHAQRRARPLPLGSAHPRPVAAVRRWRLPLDRRRPVGARRSGRGPPRAAHAGRAGDRLGNRRHAPRATPHVDHAAARVLRHLPRTGRRVPAADPPAVDDRRGARRVPVPASRRRGGRRVPRPLRPRLAPRQPGPHVRRPRLAGRRSHRDPHPAGDRHAGGARPDRVRRGVDRRPRPGPRPGPPRRASTRSGRR